MAGFVYTFRSVGVPADLRDRVFVLSQLDRDIVNLCQLIQLHSPSWILGVGNGVVTQYESTVKNVFHRSKRVLLDGPDAFSLFVPVTDLSICNVPTDSFCNWSAYRIAAFLQTERLTIPLSFLHVAKTRPELGWDEVRRIMLV